MSSSIYPNPNWTIASFFASAAMASQCVPKETPFENTLKTAIFATSYLGSCYFQYRKETLSFAGVASGVGTMASACILAAAYDAGVFERP